MSVYYILRQTGYEDSRHSVRSTEIEEESMQHTFRGTLREAIRRTVKANGILMPTLCSSRNMKFLRELLRLTADGEIVPSETECKRWKDSVAHGSLIGSSQISFAINPRRFIGTNFVRLTEDHFEPVVEWAQGMSKPAPRKTPKSPTFPITPPAHGATDSGATDYLN